MTARGSGYQRDLLFKQYARLSEIIFYNLNPKLMRDPQKPQDGRLLKTVGENIVSVVGHLEHVGPQVVPPAGRGELLVQRRVRPGVQLRTWAAWPVRLKV